LKYTGFSFLIRLLRALVIVTVFIIGLMVGLHYLGRSEPLRAPDMEEIQTILSELALFHADKGVYPADLASLGYTPKGKRSHARSEEGIRYLVGGEGQYFVLSYRETIYGEPYTHYYDSFRKEWNRSQHPPDPSTLVPGD